MKLKFCINKKLVICAIMAMSLFITTMALAQDYVPLEPLPYYGYGLEPGSSTNLSSYLETVFAFGISLAGILAVLMIVIGGIQYVTAYGNPGQTGQAKDRITQALYGLLLAICAWLILYTINPDLIKGTLDFSPYKVDLLKRGGATGEW